MTRIHYTESLEGMEPRDLDGYFVGWPDPPSPETQLRLRNGSDHAVLAIEETSGRVVGFITAVSDGVLSADIPHLEVLPEYQGQGIGSELTKRLLWRLRTLYMVDLLCDEEIQPFCERLGTRRARGMAIRNYDRQSGTAGR